MKLYDKVTMVKSVKPDLQKALECDGHTLQTQRTHKGYHVVVSGYARDNFIAAKAQRMQLILNNLRVLCVSAANIIIPAEGWTNVELFMFPLCLKRGTFVLQEHSAIGILASTVKSNIRNHKSKISRGYP
jgi:hypothetical protein